MRNTKLSLPGVTPGLCPDFSSLVHYREKQNKTKIFQSIDYLDQVLGLWEWSLCGHSSKMKA